MRNTHCATYGAQEVVRVPGPYPEGMTNVNDATALRALSHPLRLRILAEMWDEGRPLRAADLAERLDVPANSVSYHVRRLRKAGFVLDAEPPQGATARDRWYLAPERGIVFKGDDPETVQAFAEVMRPRYMTVLDGLMKAQQAPARPPVPCPVTSSWTVPGERPGRGASGAHRDAARGRGPGGRRTG